MTRHRFQGVAQIVAFNWHWYLLGAVAAAAGSLMLARSAWPDGLRFVLAAGLALAVVWSLVSLAVSHWVYDRSPLSDWSWARDALASSPRRWCHLHCGLDESSDVLRQLLPGTEGKVFDIYSPAEMSEPSIRRARTLHRGPVAQAVDYRRLPADQASMGAVFLLFTAHELRERAARTKLFSEVARVLQQDGEVVVAEHLRDLWNFCAFGPGAFHFFSRGEWLACVAAGGLRIRREFRITPFVRVFVLEKKP